MSIFGGLLLGAGTITAVYGDRITGWFPGFKPAIDRIKPWAVAVAVVGGIIATVW
jgi:hypothetical protein